jgi:hypothetical protein
MGQHKWFQGQCGKQAVTSEFLRDAAGQSSYMFFTTEACLLRNFGTVAMIAFCLFMAEKPPMESTMAKVASRALLWVVW